VASETGFGRDHPLNESETRKQRQAYFAAASFTDAQIGKVMNALEEYAALYTSTALCNVTP